MSERIVAHFRVMVLS